MKAIKEHRKKLKMARKMMSREEIKKHISPFNSKAWNERKENKETRVKNLQIEAGWKKKNKYEENI